MRTLKRLKTVELVVERRAREREVECLGSRTRGARAGDVATRRVALRIAWRERDLQRRVSPPEAGGTRSGGSGSAARRGLAERLHLLPRVVGGGGLIWEVARCGNRGGGGTRCLNLYTGAWMFVPRKAQNHGMRGTFR